MVIINEKICDNAAECSGIAVCPTGAIFWNAKEGKIDVDNSLCVSCRRCVTDGCPVGAIIVTDTVEEYEKEKRSIENDPRTVAELFVERYGAAAIDEKTIIDKDSIVNVLQDNKFVFVEEFNDDSIQCLLHSIAIQELKQQLDMDFEFFKCDVGISDDSSIYPNLLIYFDKKLLGKIEGYYDETSKDEFIKKIQEIIK